MLLSRGIRVFAGERVGGRADPSRRAEAEKVLPVLGGGGVSRSSALWSAASSLWPGVYLFGLARLCLCVEGGLGHRGLESLKERVTLPPPKM